MKDFGSLRITQSRFWFVKVFSFSLLENEFTFHGSKLTFCLVEINKKVLCDRIWTFCIFSIGIAESLWNSAWRFCWVLG
uniref:Uncharacterized protein n=1 Tax=Glycine max TaxID=3847 RepID=C6TGG2_SOYBN|nr:unknown [Glycine max]